MHANDTKRCLRPVPGAGRSWTGMLALIVGVAAGPALAGQAPPAQLALWPGPAPGSEAVSLEPRIVERSDDPARPDRLRDAVVEQSAIGQAG